MQRPTYGIVLGRFQPFHIGHLEYAACAKQKCDKLVIGITNPNIQSLRHHHADPKRSEVRNNPFPYFARHEAIAAALLYEGWPSGSFSIVPADVTDLPSLPTFLPPPLSSVVYATIYDAWGEEKVERMSALGFTVEVLWRRDMSDRATSGSEVRQKMKNGERWDHLVPTGASVFLSTYLAANPLH